MKKVLIVCLLPLGLAGCLSYSSNPPPKNTTVIVPQGSSVTCTNGQPGPC